MTFDCFEADDEWLASSSEDVFGGDENFKEFADPEPEETTQPALTMEAPSVDEVLIDLEKAAAFAEWTLLHIRDQVQTLHGGTRSHVKARFRSFFKDAPEKIAAMVQDANNLIAKAAAEFWKLKNEVEIFLQPCYEAMSTIHKAPITERLLELSQTRFCLASLSVPVVLLQPSPSTVDLSFQPGWSPKLLRLSIVEAERLSGLPAVHAGDFHSPFHRAAENGHATALETFVRLGYWEFDRLNLRGQKPICLAVLNGHAHVVEVLFRLHSEMKPGRSFIDVRDKAGNTLMALAVQKGHVHVVETLVRLGSKAIDTPDKRAGKTPMFCAVERGNIAMIEALIRLGSKAIDTPNKLETPMHEAIRSGRPRLIEALVRLGSQSLNEMDKLGRTPLDALSMQSWAIANFRECVKVLRALGATGQQADDAMQVAVDEHEVLDVRYRVYFAQPLLHRLLDIPSGWSREHDDSPFDELDNFSMETSNEEEEEENGENPFDADQEEKTEGFAERECLFGDAFDDGSASVLEAEASEFDFDAPLEFNTFGDEAEATEANVRFEDEPTTAEEETAL